jgi:hypothetical protein
MGIITAELTKGGYLYKTGSNWSTLENSTTAASVDLSGVQTKAGATYDGFTYELFRTYISFDTSPLIGASVSNITLNIYWDPFPAGGKIACLESPKSLSTTLNTSHFDKTTFGTFYFDISPAGTFSSITLNNDAINDAVTGELNIVLIEYSYDYSTSTLSIGEESGRYIYYDTPGLYPYIEYTLVNKVNGINNYGKVNGIEPPFKINGVV